MISRKSAKLISDIYEIHFTAITTDASMRMSGPELKKQELYDFLYQLDYEADFITIVEQFVDRAAQSLSRFIKRIHTGESLNTITMNWEPEKKFALGQHLLKKLATDIINEYGNRPHPALLTFADSNDVIMKDMQLRMNIALERPFKLIENLKKQLELDGYIYRDGTLYFSESFVIPVEEEQSILTLLINKLPINSKLIIINHLKLSEEHYLNGKWGDCISNSRHFLEEILKQVALHINSKKGLTIPELEFDKPVKVRDFLEQEDFIDPKEKEAIAKIYGLISHTGGHPNLAEQDEARLMRHLSLTFSQYILLTFETYLKNNP